MCRSSRLAFRSATLQRVQGRIRHKRCPLRATPIYSVSILSSLTLRAKEVPVVLPLIPARSYLALSYQTQTFLLQTNPFKLRCNLSF